jgi:hypothetical protein
MVHRAPLSLLVFAAALAAQSSVVLPASHAAAEGSSSSNVPFGRSSPVRVQTYYDAMLFAGPVTITAVALRLDGGSTAAGKQVDCEIRMSTSPRPLVLLDPDFALNRGGDEAVVLPQQLLTLPAGGAAATPNAFLPPIPLAVPFAYDPQVGGLLLEIVVHAQPPGTYPLDVTWVCASPDLAVGPAACPQPGASPLRVESATTQVIWGRPWVARVLDAPPGAFVVFGLGTIDSGPWAGFVLPQDLTALGAPGCFLSIDLAGTWFQIAAGDGSAVFPFNIPNSPWLVGLWLRFQGGAFNAQANALGVVTSQARKVQVCGFEPVGRVWATSTGAAHGTREIGVAPVVELVVQ